MRAKSLTVLDKREVEKVGRLIGMDLSGKFVLRDWEGGIWVSSRMMSQLDFSKINVSSIGLRIATVNDDGSLKRSYL